MPDNLRDDILRTYTADINYDADGIKLFKFLDTVQVSKLIEANLITEKLTNFIKKYPTTLFFGKINNPKHEKPYVKFTMIILDSSRVAKHKLLIRELLLTGLKIKSFKKLDKQFIVIFA